MTRIRREIHACVVGLAVLLAGCASTPPPLGRLDDAQRALAAAQESRAGDYAPVELGLAQQRLAEAQAAMQRRDYAAAQALAAEAEVDAALADARSRAAQGRAAVQRQSEENARLRRELLGGGGR